MYRSYVERQGGSCPRTGAPGTRAVRAGVGIAPFVLSAKSTCHVGGASGRAGRPARGHPREALYI
jgi:hypothetical protein